MREILDLFKNMILYGLEKFGLFYSDYRGYVYDNNDPNGFGRLKVNVPEVFGDNILDYWAWPANNFSGNGYGTQCIPQRNDMVWVRFEKGNPRKPIWNFGHFGKNEKPDNLKNVKNYWFKTPGGNLVQFNDDSKSITITSTNNHSIDLSEDSITIASKQGHTIILDDNGISITASDLKPITIGGNKQVLYATIPDSVAIANVSQIGVSQTIKVGE